MVGLAGPVEGGRHEFRQAPGSGDQDDGGPWLQRNGRCRE